VAHFLVLTVNYAPEPTGFAPHAKALVDHLVSRNHSVTVCTGFPFAPRWQRWEEYRHKFLSRTPVGDRTVVIRVSHFIPRRPSSALQRVVMEATFVLSAAFALIGELVLRRRLPDVVLYIGAQPAIAMLARVVAASVRSPYFVNVNDIATQAAVDVGIVRRPWIQQVLSRFEFAAYRKAAGASVLCRRFAELLVEQGFGADRIRTIRSPIDISTIQPVERDGHFRNRYGIPADAFVVLFSGSMGLKQGLANVVAAADRCRATSVARGRPLHWVLVGDGEAKCAILDLVASHRLASTISVVGFEPEQGMSAMFAAADVLLLNQVSKVKDSVVPSKLLTYMAAGRPILAAVNPSSQGAEILSDARGGLVVAPDDPEALARGTQQLSAMPVADLAVMGARNRAYAEQHFDQRKILAEHEAFMLDALSLPTARPSHGTT
jgi:colanic acid biosynthesis glycosyl transferase WcaI